MVLCTANYDVNPAQLTLRRDEYVLLKPEYVIPEFLMHEKRCLMTWQNSLLIMVNMHQD